MSLFHIYINRKRIKSWLFCNKTKRKCPIHLAKQKPGLSCLRRWVVPSLFCLNLPPTKRSAPYSELGLKCFSRCSALELKTCKLSVIVCLPLPDTKKLKNGKFVIQVEHAFILSDCHLTQTQWCFFLSFFSCFFIIF